MDRQSKRVQTTKLKQGNKDEEEKGQAKRMLDLFSGTGSVGDEFRRQGFQDVSIDIDPRCEPNHIVDVLNYKY